MAKTERPGRTYQSKRFEFSLKTQKGARGERVEAQRDRAIRWVPVRRMREHMAVSEHCRHQGSYLKSKGLRHFVRFVPQYMQQPFSSYAMRSQLCTRYVVYKMCSCSAMVVGLAAMYFLIFAALLRNWACLYINNRSTTSMSRITGSIFQTYGKFGTGEMMPSAGTASTR